MRTISPSDTPAGIVRRISSSCLAIPSPLQASHGCSGVSPRPMQRGHVRVLVKLPKKVLRDSRTCPFPLQEAHEVIREPFLAPVPEHSLHTFILAMRTRLSVPKIDSRKESSMSMETSRPRGFPPREKGPVSPEKNSPKMSPRSPPKAGPPPAENCEKSNPPNPPACWPPPAKVFP